MKTFTTKTYYLSIKKMNGRKPVRFAILSDLHGLSFGPENGRLLQGIIDGKPDAVMIPGDMICSSDPGTLNPIAGFLCRLAEKYPVYYALGNHESRMLLDPEMQDAYLRYERMLTDSGVCFLHNEHTAMRLQDTDFVFYGLELPGEYFHKPKAPFLSLTSIEALVGHPFQDGIHVLLAHNPRYGNTYFSWGADLIFSGHYHGGILRLSENRGFISPQFQIFPSFCCGSFKRGDSHMVVSAGLGEHTIPVRIHNPRELIFVELASPDRQPT